MWRQEDDPEEETVTSRESIARFVNLAKDEITARRPQQPKAQNELLRNLDGVCVRKEREKKNAKNDQGDPNLIALDQIENLDDGLDTEPFFRFLAPRYALPIYLVLLQMTRFALGFHSLVYCVLYGLPVLFVYLSFPAFLGWLLTWILREFVIFDNQLSIGMIHLRPWVTKGQFHLYIHVENLKFGMSEGFQLEFLHVKDFRMSIHMLLRDIRNAIGIVGNWSPVGSEAYNTRDCPTLEEQAIRDRRKLEEKKKRRGTAAPPLLREESDAAPSSRDSEGSVRTSEEGPNPSPGENQYGVSGVGLFAYPKKMPHLKPRLGVIRIGSLDIDGAIINFETNHSSDFIVNAFVRDLAVAKCRQVLGRRPMPNMLKVRILKAKNLKPVHQTQKAVNAKVTVTARQETAETHVAMHTTDPTFHCDFVLPVDDPSTVVHIQVMDSSFVGSRVIGQWVMTTYWLAVDPCHCKFTPGTLYTSKEKCAIRGWLPLMDFQHQHGDGSTGELLVELQWYYEDQKGVEGAAKAKLPALEQLQENSAETWLRLGDVDRVMTMLETFPYKIEIQRSTLRNVHFFLGDLFAGRQGLAETTGRAKGIRVKYIEMDDSIFASSMSKNVPGVSLKEFLYSFFIKGLAPAVIGSGAIVGSGLREILYSLIMGRHESIAGRLVHLVTSMDIRDNIHSMLEPSTYARVLMMSMGVHNYHSKTIGKEDSDVFSEVKLGGYLLKADKPPGTLMRKYRRIYMTIQGTTIFYWHTKSAEPQKQTGEGRKMYIEFITVAEVGGPDEEDLIIVQNDGKHRWFRMVDPPECDRLPKLEDWVRSIREQRVIMKHPELRAEAEMHEQQRQERQLAEYSAVH